MDRIRAAVVAGVVLCGCRGAEARRTADSAAYIADSIAIIRADSTARARQDSVNRAQPGYIVDSILPVEEALRRFRADLKEDPLRFTGGAASRGALVERFVRALERGDTASLHAMALSRAEYAYLVYPSSPYTKPPYRQPPWLTWMLLERESAAGLTRLLRRWSGTSLGYAGYECRSALERQGRNVLWKECSVRLARGSSRLFGTLIERDGRWKFMTFANDF